MICQQCGAEVEENEYHPHAFCVLVQAGLNPLAVVLEAVNQLGLAAPGSGYQPMYGEFDDSNPPRGGSGVGEVTG